MSRVKLYSVIVMLGLLALLAGACAPEPVATPTPSPPSTSEEMPASEPVPTVTPVSPNASSEECPTTPTLPGASEEVLTGEPSPSMEASDEESQRIAEGFLRSSLTFIFDGIEESVRLVDTIAPQRMPDYRVFLFTFDSGHAGHGDRTGQVLAEVITPHKVAITVDQGKIILALMDRKWDMLTQKEVSPS